MACLWSSAFGGFISPLAKLLPEFSDVRLGSRLLQQSLDWWLATRLLFGLNEDRFEPAGGVWDWGLVAVRPMLVLLPLLLSQELDMSGISGSDSDSLESDGA